MPKRTVPPLFIIVTIPVVDAAVLSHNSLSWELVRSTKLACLLLYIYGLFSDVLQNSSRCHECKHEVHSQFSNFVIIISSTVGGVCLLCFTFTSMCMCLCCVRYKKQRHRQNSISAAVDQGAGIEKDPVYDTIDPVYDTIDPAYEVISDTGLGGEIKLTVTMNDAYNC